MNNSIIISNDISLLDALGIMDKNNRKLLVVCDNDLFDGAGSFVSSGSGSSFDVGIDPVGTHHDLPQAL